MKHPILPYIEKQFPDVKITHKAPANCIQQIDYADQTCWHHEDFRIIAQDYDSKDAYFCWLEIKTNIILSFTISSTVEDLFWLYQLKGSIQIKQIPESGEPDDSLDRLEEDQYAIFYTSPKEYLVTFDSGHHYLFFYVINANWQERHAEQEPLYFQELSEALYEKREGFLSSKAMSIHPAIRKEIFQLGSLTRQNGLSTDVMVYVPLSKLLASSKEDLQGRTLKRNTIEIETLEAIRDYIKEQVQLGNIPPIAEIAEYFKITIQRLRIIHKREYGHSLQSFITTERLTVGADRLINTDLPITTIAQDLGYDTNTFLRQFKMYYNLTPSEFRSQYREGI